MRYLVLFFIASILFVGLWDGRALAADLKELQKQLEEINDKLIKLIDQADDDLITNSEYERLVKPLEDQRAVVRAEIGAIKAVPILRRLEFLENNLPKDARAHNQIRALELELLQMDPLKYQEYIQAHKARRAGQSARYGLKAAEVLKKAKDGERMTREGSQLSRWVAGWMKIMKR